MYSYPADAQPLGFSPLCEVQGMLVPGRVITVQGHPEFNEKIMTELLEVRHEQKIFDDATFEDGIRRVSKSHDGVLVAGVFLKFLLEGKTT